MALEYANAAQYIKMYDIYREQRKSGCHLEDLGVDRTAGVYILSPWKGYDILEEETKEQYFFIKVGLATYNKTGKKSRYRGLLDRLDQYLLYMVGIRIWAIFTTDTNEQANELETKLIQFLTGKLKFDPDMDRKAFHSHETEVFFVSSTVMKSVMQIMGNDNFWIENIGWTPTTRQFPTKLYTYGVKRNTRVSKSATTPERQSWDQFATDTVIETVRFERNHNNKRQRVESHGVLDFRDADKIDEKDNE